MIAPKCSSHVQPSGRDYSGTTSPDLIESVPLELLSPADYENVSQPSMNLWWDDEPRLDGDVWRDEADEGIAGYDSEIDAVDVEPARACRADESTCADCLGHCRPEAGRVTVAGAFLLAVILLGVGMFAALTALGMPETPASHLWTVGNYR
jgi:hypothetical protein